MKLWPFSRKSESFKLVRDYLRAMGGTKAGAHVTLETALKVSAVFGCARVIANGLAQVPLKLYHEDTRKPAREHPLYKLLHRKPNDWQTSFEFRETMGYHLVLAGRFVAFKNVVRGQVAELIPFEPNDVRITRASDYSLTFHVRGDNGQEQAFPQSAIWYVRGPSWNSWEAWNAIKLARESIGLAIALEEHHALMHANGVSPPGVYSVDGSLTETQHEQLRKFIKENYSGSSRGLPMIVDRNAKWLSTAMNGVDSQHLETRRFQVEETCRHLGVQPIMVYQSDKTQSFASVEQLLIAHIVHTMNPWYERVQQSVDVNVLSDDDTRNGIYSKFSVAALMHGAMKDRGEYFSRALGAGGSQAWMTPDDVREWEELPPLGGIAAELPARLGTQTRTDPASTDPQGATP